MKNLNIHPFYLVVGAALIFGFTMQNGQEHPAQDRVITVTGSADMLVPPDEISLDVTYREYWHVVNKKKASITEIEKEIIEAADDAGIPKEDIVINTAYAWKHRWNYWYYWWDYYNQLAEKNLTIKVKNSAQLNNMIQNLKKGNINRNAILNIQLNGSSNKKIQEYRKMVKERAIQAAQEKADYLLDALGEKRGRVLNISELSDPQTTTTIQGGAYPYYHPYWGWSGGYLGSTTIDNGGLNAVSNSSVSMPSSGGSAGAANGGEDGLGMKPIKLRYEIQAVFTIAN